MLSLQKQIKHAKFIAQWADEEFIWGETDCLQFLFAWYDYVNGSNHRERIYQKYHSKRSAAVFFAEFGMSATQWMTLRKFGKYEYFGDNAQEGDVAIIQHKYYPSAYIYHNGLWWTAFENQLLHAVTALPEGATHWRL